MNQLVKLLAVLSLAAMALALAKGALRPPTGAMSKTWEEVPR